MYISPVRFGTVSRSCNYAESLRTLQIPSFFVLLIRMVRDPWRAEEEEGYDLILERFWVERKIIEHMVAMYILYDVTF